MLVQHVADVVEDEGLFGQEGGDIAEVELADGLGHPHQGQGMAGVAGDEGRLRIGCSGQALPLQKLVPGLVRELAQCQ